MAIIPIAGKVELPNWKDVIYREDFLQAMSSTTRVISGRVELLDPSGEPVRDLPVDSVSLGCDSTADLMWECSATISDMSLIPKDPTDVLHPFSGYSIKLWWMIKLPTTWAEIPCGRYFINNPSVDRTKDGVKFSIQGIDVMNEIRKNLWSGDYMVPVGGLTHGAAIRKIIVDRAPHLEVRLDGYGGVLPTNYEVGEAGRDPLEDIKSLADAGGLIVRADREGVIVIKDKMTKVNRELDLTYISLSLNRSLDISSVANRVTVRSSSSQVVPPVYATVEDKNPDSPLYVGRGRIWSVVENMDSLTTVEDCKRAAEALLAERAVVMEPLSVPIPTRPDLEPGCQLIMHDEPSRTDGVWECSGWSMELGPGSTMGLKILPRKVTL